MSKELATIQKVSKITPIEGKDRIEQLEVLGWTLIAKKGQFKVGDYCVYFEIGSKLYPHECWDAFLAKCKWRIKTMKMAGTLSQGLALPLSIYKVLTGKELKNPKEGMDVTEDLKVTKHIPKKAKEPNMASPKKKMNPVAKYFFKYGWFRAVYKFILGHAPNGDFPKHILPETDETNIQSIPQILKNNVGETFYVTEKLEGQSATYAIQPKFGLLDKLFGKKEFIVCSHHTRRCYPDQSNWWEIAEKESIFMRLKHAYQDKGIHFGIQGEIVGPRIQGNIYNLEELEFYVFNVWDLDARKKLSKYDTEHFCLEYFFDMVPVIDEEFVITEDTTPQSILQMSDGKSMLNKNTNREGLVIRSTDMKVSFKARSPLYLMKTDPELED